MRWTPQNKSFGLSPRMQRLAAEQAARPRKLVPYAPSFAMPEPMAGAPDQQNTLQSLGGAVSRGRRRRGLSISGVGTFG
jgi:hypothetical protein